jgi:hypothetical protein
VLLAADGDHAWVGGRSLVELVRKSDTTKAQTITLDERRADLADSRRDVVFLHEKGGDGPTALSDPGALAWHAPFTPLGISRGAGAYVAGLKGTNTVEIRRMDDGSLVRDLPVKYDYDAGDELGWDGDTAVLFDVEGPRRTYALERCDVVSGHCAVVTPWSRYQYSLAESIHEQV